MPEPSDALRTALKPRRYRFWPGTLDVAFRANFRCEYCDKDLLASVDVYQGDWQRDHVVPRALGGADEIHNWALVCRLCNQLKSHWDPRRHASDAADRDALVAATVQYIRALRAPLVTQYEEVRALILSELAR